MDRPGGPLGGRRSPSGGPRSPSGARRPALVGLIAALSLVGGGCQFLYGFDPTAPDFSMPSPAATYREGRATVTIGSEPAIVLGDLSQPGTLDATLGAEATFSNADGWYVRVMGATTPRGFMGQFAWVQIDRIVDRQHWTTFDSTRCVVTIAAADADALRGSATCKGLRWADAIGGNMGGLEPNYIPGQPAFDAEITFEAAPDKTRVG